MSRLATTGSRPIIVLGAERSGTSVVAEMVHAWGAFAGEADRLPQPDRHNPRGRWEYKPLWDFLAEVGDFAQGVSWWDPSFDGYVTAKLGRPEVRKAALDLMAEMERPRRPWVWKDPALAFFLSFWKPLWCDPVYIVTVRHPLDTARSWEEFVLPAAVRGSVSLVRGNLLRWQYMMRLILAGTEGAARLFVRYEDLMADPVSGARRIASFLDERFGPGKEPSRVEAMARVVDPGLWRVRCRVPFREASEATEQQRALYDLALRLVADPKVPFAPDEYRLPPGWRERVKEDEDLVRAHSGSGEGSGGT